jgi:hypothetical protein
MTDDELILTELRTILDDAPSWALECDLAEDETGFSLIGSIRDAVDAGTVGLALDRYGDLGSHQPLLSALAQDWVKA